MDIRNELLAALRFELEQQKYILAEKQRAVHRAQMDLVDTHKNTIDIQLKIIDLLTE